MQAELPSLWPSPSAILVTLGEGELGGAIQGEREKKEREKPFLKNHSGVHANLRQLLMLNSNIKDLLCLPAPPPPPPPQNCEKTRSWWAANKN